MTAVQRFWVCVLLSAMHSLKTRQMSGFLQAWLRGYDICEQQTNKTMRGGHLSTTRYYIILDIGKIIDLTALIYTIG